jgi:hypothetical protein
LNFDGEGTTIGLRAVFDSPVTGLRAIDFDGRDVQEAGVKNDLFGLLVCDGFQLGNNEYLPLRGNLVVYVDVLREAQVASDWRPAR